MISTSNQDEREDIEGRIDLLLSGLPLEKLDVFSGLPDGGAGLDERTIGLSLGILGRHDAVAGVCDGRVFGRAAAEEAAAA